MALMQKSDLKYTYSWTAIRPDDPKVSGPPDSTMFNRYEGYEVLYLINRFAHEYDLKQKSFGHKIEKMINEYLPSDIRSQTKVKDWIGNNWKKY